MESSSDFFKSVNFWQNYGRESEAPLFWSTLYVRAGLRLCEAPRQIPYIQYADVCQGLRL